MQYRDLYVCKILERACSEFSVLNIPCMQDIAMSKFELGEFLHVWVKNKVKVPRKALRWKDGEIEMRSESLP